jgi:AhpD family alkylhydroperoxidase
MSQRLNYQAQSPELTKKYLDFSLANKHSKIEESTRLLVEIRASQINGCAFCVDMHSKQAKITGERELRLYHLPIWRESPLFSDRERAALEWTEALTTLGAHGVPDDIYAAVRSQFNEQEIADLSFQIVAINGWNRLGVAFRNVPGTLDEAYGLTRANLN